ncbi:MAG: hypothetical protein Q8O79_07550 [Pseudomonadota bacterium]|nr:hypothetical protein [Pseudomonadota bacterium]
MQAGNTNGFEAEHLRKWWQATRDYLFADFESLPESAVQTEDAWAQPETNAGRKRYASVLWIGLALAAGACPPLASATDAAPLALAAAPQFRPDFSGHWALNAKASDDPQETLKAAMQAMQPAKGGGRGMGGGSGGQGRGGGMGGGRHGRGSPEGMGGRGEMPSREMSALIAAAGKLDITHADPMLLIADENEQRQRLFTDFRGASVSASGGLRQQVAVAGWEGTALVVETTMIGGTKLIQHYQIDADTGQLVISAVVHPAEIRPVPFRLVYDRLKPAMDVKERN